MKWDFSSKAWVQLPVSFYGVGQRPKFYFLKNMIMLYIKVKGMMHAET